MYSDDPSDSLSKGETSSLLKILVNIFKEEWK